MSCFAGNTRTLAHRAAAVCPFRRPSNSERACPLTPRGEGQAKKNDVTEHPLAFDHVGLLVNEPPGMAGLPFS